MSEPPVRQFPPFARLLCSLLNRLQERAKEASERRELANRRLGQYELGSGLIQIAIVLASAAIITGTAALWFSIGLGVIGAALLAFGFWPDGVDLHRLEQNTINCIIAAGGETICAFGGTGSV